MTRVKRLAGFLLLAGLSLVSSSAHAQSLTASLDREVISMGDTVTLTLRFTDVAPDGQPSIPEIPGLRQLAVSSSQQFSTVNGRMSSSVSYQYTLSPAREGTIQIPAMRMQVAGRTLSTQPLTLRVNAMPPPPASEEGISNQVAFVRLVLPRQEAYVGEMLVAEMQLHLSDAVQRLSNFQMQPVATDGFTVGEMVEGQRRQVRLANRLWTVVPLQLPITTIKSGPLTLGPIYCSFTINDDPFDPFGMFNRGRAAKINLRSDEAPLQSLPLPRANVPPSFSGAVGKFDMTVSAGPTNLAVGDPLTLRVQIAGEGQLEGISLPEQKSWTDLRTIQTKNDVQVTGKLGLSGVKTFEQVLIPESDRITALPPFEFSFFDPGAKSYRTLTHPAIPLHMRPAGALPVPVVAASPDTRQREEQERDIVHIKTRIGSVMATSPVLLRAPWFLGLASLPVLLYAASVIWRRRTDALANNPRLRRKREVDALVHKGLHDLRRQASANDSDAFFAGVFRLLQERIGERLNVPASSITESVIDEQLTSRELSEEIRAQLHELFQICNLARYAPATSSQELNALVPKVEKVLHDLEALR